MLRRVEARRWSAAAMLLGLMLLTGALILPADGKANPESGWHSHHERDKRDFAGRALHRLLREQRDLNLSEEQVGKIKAVALDYAKTRIRDKAEVKLAEVDVRALIVDEKSELSAIEAAMRKSENAKIVLRLDRVKAMRAAAAVLSPEQREKWRASMWERHRDRGHGQEYGEGPGSPDLPKRDG